MSDPMEIIGEDFSEPEPVEVNKADASAADELMVHIGGLLPRGNMLDVEADVAKMFAAHRIQSEAAMREALDQRNAKVAPCPYMNGSKASSDDLCKLCGADSTEPCRKRVIADAEFVDAIRAALHPESKPS